MIQLLSDLDPEDRENKAIQEVDRLLQEICVYGLGGTNTGYLKVVRIWRVITGHLHVYYFREFHIRPRNPNPEHIHADDDQQPENTEPKHIGA
jgi:hypothetical protein